MTSTYAVVNPATGETIKEFPTITDDELRDAIGRADAAYESGRLLHRRRARGADPQGRRPAQGAQPGAGQIIAREMGKPIAQAVGEADFAGDIYHFYADNAEDLMADEPIKLLGGDGTAVVRRSSYGRLLGIMPWNYPYYQVARFAGPNLIIGNPILLKHAPQCPESAEAMQKIFDEAGFPEGAYENIYATNDQIEWVIGDPRVHGVSVTGSERAGAAVAEIAGRNLKKVVLELGGSDPFIVLGTDDVGAVAAGGRSALRERRPGLQRGEALHRQRRVLRRIRRQAESPARRGQGEAIRAARTRRSGRSPRRPRPTGSRTRSSGRSTAAPRSSSAAGATATTSSRRSSPGSSRAARPPRKSSSARSPRSTRSAPRRRRSSSPTTPSSGSAPT